MFPGVVLSNADSVHVRIIDGTVFALVAMEAIHGPQLEGTSPAAQTLIVDAMQGDDDGPTPPLKILDACPLPLLVYELKPPGAMLVTPSHVKVHHLHPALGGAEWGSLHVHVAVHPLRSYALPLADVVVAGGRARLGVAEVAAGGDRIFHQHPHVDELLLVEADLEDGLGENVEVSLYVVNYRVQ